MNRKQFLAKLVQGAGLATVGGVAWSSLLSELKAAPLVLRPPGALEEERFQQQCIKCGLCVSSCPYDTLILAAPGDHNPLGMPYLIPRETPCYLCEDIPCVAACPSGALDETRVQKKENGDGARTWDVSKTRIGVAVIDEENCIATWGIQCDACYRACPYLDRAITLEYSRNDRTGKHAFRLPKIHNDICTGCGLCEHACVTEKAAVYILPRDVALGKVGAGYIKGWDRRDENRLRQVSPDLPEKEGRGKQPAIDYLNDELLLND